MNTDYIVEQNVPDDEMKTKFPKLWHFLAAYFHQDCDLDAETSEEIVDDYMQGTDKATKVELISEITVFLDLHRHELETTYVSNFTNECIIFKAGADCLPMPEDMSAFDWLAMIKERLIKETGA